MKWRGLVLLVLVSLVLTGGCVARVPHTGGTVIIVRLGAALWKS